MELPTFSPHPLRLILSDEIHARPPLALDTPERVSYLAFTHDHRSAADELAHVGQLLAAHGFAAPAADANHVLFETAALRFKWERHSEFSSYYFSERQPDYLADDGRGALARLDPHWLEALPGQLIAAVEVELRDADAGQAEQLLQNAAGEQRTLVAAEVAGGAARVVSDFLLHNGFSRFTVLDRSLTPRQAGRIVQRLVEIETYRVMALLAFPLAREVSGLLRSAETELADLMDSMSQARNAADDHAALSRLSTLAAQVERSVARSAYRFGAAAAYYRLVRQRIEDLREQRIAGFSPIGEFMDRRLTPAIDTCASVARRQEELSARIARNSQLLRTRVDIEIERQNQQLLEQMNRRAKIQLHLQETVEGLSVVAITYYGSQLVNYVSQGLQPWLAPQLPWLTPPVITAAAIPLIALTVFASLRRLRLHLSAEAGQQD